MTEILVELPEPVLIIGIQMEEAPPRGLAAGELSLPPVDVRRNRESRRRATIAAKTARASEVGHLAKLAIRLQSPEGLPLPGGLLRAIWIYSRGVRPDPDNIIATLKWDLDALVKVGVFTDDDDVNYLPPIRRKGKRPRLILEVYDAALNCRRRVCRDEEEDR